MSDNPGDYNPETWENLLKNPDLVRGKKIFLKTFALPQNPRRVSRTKQTSEKDLPVPKGLITL